MAAVSGVRGSILLLAAWREFSNNRRARSPERLEGDLLASSTMLRNQKGSMLQFTPAGEKWWQKPLVTYGGRVLPAELAVLRGELGPGEEGVWLNSRGTKTGVADLVRGADGKFTTIRATLPTFVSWELAELYVVTGLPKGMPDLVIWNAVSETLRLVEVKCPHWDRPSLEQDAFLAIAAANGVPSKIVDWEFRNYR
jgi:hypothetical protein